MILSAAILCGFLLDLLLADPSWMPHPVVFMGKFISHSERILRSHLPKTPEGERLAGKCLAFALPFLTLALSGGVCFVAYSIHPLLFFLVETVWSWQVLAARGLAQEAANVYYALTTQTLEDARRAVARIVGRDTQNLTAEGVTKAAVETVAENFSDGVVAPLFYLLLGGAPLALCYKSINTMDSMIGYKNDRYLHFGRAAALLDDKANYLPARLSALLWIAAAALSGNDAKQAFRIWRRDRHNHASPNSAQTESACAGALGVQLAGPAFYFGKRYDKPTIGDPTHPILPLDILKANTMLYWGSVLAVLFGLFLRYLVLSALPF